MSQGGVAKQRGQTSKPQIVCKRTLGQLRGWCPIGRSAEGAHRDGGFSHKCCVRHTTFVHQTLCTIPHDARSVQLVCRYERPTVVVPVGAEEVRHGRRVRNRAVLTCDVLLRHLF